MTTILITSIGSISAMGTVFCLGDSRASIRVVGTNSVAHAAGNFLADKTYLVPHTAEAERCRAAIERVIDAEKPAVVLNGRDEELRILGALREAGAFPATSFLVPPLALESVFNDKYRTAGFARDNSLPFADTAFLPDEVERLLRRCGLPLICKPRWDGFGSNGVFLVADERQLWAATETGLCVIQEMLPSSALDGSIAAWKGQLGMPWAFCVHDQRHQVDMVLGRAGEVLALWISVGDTDGAIHRNLRILDEPGMRDVGEGYAAALGGLGQVGPLNLQGKLLADGRFVPFELNARFTGMTVGAAKLGFNLVLTALEHWGVVDAGTSRMKATGKALERVPLFLEFDERDARLLAQRGEWERSTG